jgi:hypothetical protein
MDTTQVRSFVLSLFEIFSHEEAENFLCELYAHQKESKLLPMIEYLVRGIYADKDYN